MSLSRASIVLGPVAIAITASCGGSGSTGGGAFDAGPGLDGRGSGACTSNADCASQLPTTTPAGCATGTCNTIQGVCVFSAKDEDGDGYSAADCKSTDGAAIVDGDDCNDHDPHLYPGHPESCVTLADGGAPGPGLCRPGVTACQSDGTQSPCANVVVCTKQACVNANCQGVCAPGQTQCAQNGVETCTSSGTWSAPAICVSSMCISSASGAACEGQCSAGQTGCNGEQPETCVNGSWQANGSSCSGATPVCAGGSCVLCAPHSLTCAGSQPQQCDSTGAGWLNLGPPCASNTPVCNGGACVECAAGAVGCLGQQPRTCDSTGTWQGTGGACVGQTCVGGTCTGTCGPPGTQQCVGNAVATCDASGAWGVPVACSSPTSSCCAGTCVDETSDSNNCGACGQACGAGPCTVGSCDVVLASNQAWSLAITVDSSSVYWTNNNGTGTTNQSGYLCKVPIAGGTVTTLVTGVNYPNALAVDATSAYFASGTNPSDVLKVSVGGGTAITLLAGSGELDGIAVEGPNLYWLNGFQRTVMKIPAAGGTPTTLASRPSAPLSLASDAVSLYWTEASEILKIPLGGGAVATLATGQNAPSGIAVNSSQVFWANNGDGSIVGTSLGGGATATLASNQSSAQYIAVDSSSVYWAAVDSTATAFIYKLPVGGGAPTKVASGRTASGTDIGPMIVDSTSIYWITLDGEIMKGKK